MKNNIEIEYREIDLGDVMKNYQKAFLAKPGYKIISAGQEWLLDTNKQKVIFKFLIEEK